MPLQLGIDLTEDYIAVYEQGEENASVFPAVICREKKQEAWHMGEEAYRLALNGQGVITDKLLKLLRKNGNSTIEGHTYTAGELLSKLLFLVIAAQLNTSDFSEVDSVGLALHEPDASLMDRVKKSLVEAGISSDKIVMLTHEEAVACYMLSRPRQLCSSAVALFDLSSETFTYYEFMMVRGLSRTACAVQGEDLVEAFHTDILKKESGKTLGDRIITDVARKRMDGRQFSSVLLTGAGFEQTDWAQSFLSYVCRRRRVLVEQGLFAIGAAVSGAWEMQPEEGEDCLIFCNSRIRSELSTEVTIGERTSRLILVPAGARWYGLNIHVELIPRGQDCMELEMEPFDRKGNKHITRVGFGGLPKRPDRTTRIALDLAFDEAEKARVSITDMGFGELFPATDTVLREEIRL